MPLTPARGQDGANLGVFGRRFSSASSGAFVVTWDADGGDDSEYAVFAQRFGPLAPLDVDGDGTVSALVDGLLVPLFLFGFGGGSLITGALGGGCTRCTAEAVSAYLAGLGPVLDVDGNTSLEALTDGLLVLRYLFGFDGATLTTGAVGMGCSRCDAAAIKGCLADLT